jgi:uncharacterized membrane protein
MFVTAAIIWRHYPGHIPAAVMMLAAVAAVWACYRFLRRGISSPVGATLRATRMAALLLLCLILFDPAAVRPRPTKEPVRVTTLLDCSRSMAARDTAAGVARLDRARDIVTRQILPVPGRLEHRIVAFADTAREETNLETLRADGPGTDLAGALRQVAADQRRPDRIVLITDGNATRGDNPVEHVRSLSGIPVFAVGLGSLTGPPDAGIGEVSAPRQVMLDDAIPVAVSIFQRNVDADREAAIVVQRDGEPLLARRVRLGSAALQRVRFEIPADRLGWNEYRVSVYVPGLQDEFSTVNNHATIPVRVSRRIPAKVLYIEHSLRWSTRFLTAALTGDEGIALDARLDIVPVARRNGEQPPVFPASRETLFGYDVVVLGSMPAAVFTEANLQDLCDFVSVRGGGLAMVGGLESLHELGYGGTPLAAALPVHVPDTTKTERTGPIAVEAVVTTEGRIHPVMEAFAAIETDLPPLSRIDTVYAPKPSASVLLATRDDAAPLVLAQRYGRGHVLFSASGHFWQWAFPGREARVAGEPTLFDGFWSAAVRWLAANAGSDSRFRLYATPGQPGEPVRVSCEVFNERYEPETDVDVILNAGPAAYAMRPVPREPGLYSAEIDPGGGNNLVLRAQVSRHGVAIGETRYALRPDVRDEEAERPGLNEPVLRQLAERSGGYYLDESRAEDLPRLLTAADGRTPPAVDEHTLWARWPVLILLLGLLTAEWFIRRRTGLA